MFTKRIRSVRKTRISEEGECMSIPPVQKKGKPVSKIHKEESFFPPSDETLDHKNEESRKNYATKERDVEYLPINRKYGPIKTPKNIRDTIRLDHQPHVCKDYKETGFCGFGDTCVFLHDRTEYKMGWELEKEWEEKKMREKQDPPLEEHYVQQEYIDPFCPICEKEFANPVQTECMHYFCEKCAIEKAMRSKACFVCKKAINGKFVVAKPFIKKLQERKERDKKLSEEREQIENMFI